MTSLSQRIAKLETRTPTDRSTLAPEDEAILGALAALCEHPSMQSDEPVHVEEGFALRITYPAGWRSRDDKLAALLGRLEADAAITEDVELLAGLPACGLGWQDLVRLAMGDFA